MTIPLLNPYLDLHAPLSEQSPELQLQLRKKLIWAYAWAVPSDEAIRAIATHSPILEIGAGTGYWAWLLRQAGARVTAFDQEPSQPPHWSTVEKGDALRAADFPAHALFLCWPPLESPMALDALHAFRGQTLIYAGEWRRRTADTAFHDELDRDWTLTRELELPRWPGFHDSVRFFDRR